MQRLGLIVLVSAVLGLPAAAQAVTGSGWKVEPMPPQPTGSNLIGVSCSSTKACTAVGYSVDGTLAERWDGRAWTIQSTPSLGQKGQATLAAVSCSSKRDCIAVGDNSTMTTCTPACHFSDATLAEHWSGRTWTVLPTPTLSASSDLNAVSCVTANHCIAVGKSGTTSLAELWDGHAWQIQPMPSVPVGAFLDGVSCASANACMAVGVISSSKRTLIERWDGRKWKILPPAPQLGPRRPLRGFVPLPDVLHRGRPQPVPLAPVG